MPRAGDNIFFFLGGGRRGRPLTRPALLTVVWASASRSAAVGAEQRRGLVGAGGRQIAPLPEPRQHEEQAGQRPAEKRALERDIEEMALELTGDERGLRADEMKNLDDIAAAGKRGTFIYAEIVA